MLGIFGLRWGWVCGLILTKQVLYHWPIPEHYLPHFYHWIHLSKPERYMRVLLLTHLQNPILLPSVVMKTSLASDLLVTSVVLKSDSSRYEELHATSQSHFFSVQWAHRQDLKWTMTFPLGGAHITLEEILLETSAYKWVLYSLVSYNQPHIPQWPQ